MAAGLTAFSELLCKAEWLRHEEDRARVQWIFLSVSESAAHLFQASVEWEMGEKLGIPPTSQALPT